MRKALSKKTRFEIFKRDGFTCQYCGKQPPDVVLVVDHINPVANGGDNDQMNLVTSCETCNQGKGAVLLTKSINRPDADVEWLEMQQEIIELRRYQIAKAERDRIFAEIIEGLQNTWIDCIGGKYCPNDTSFRMWLTFATPEQIEEAIRITGGKTFTIRGFDNQVRYFAGVLRNITGTRKDEENG